MDTKRTETSSDDNTTAAAGAHTSTEPAAPSAWGKVIGIAVGLSLLVGVLVTAFAWPASNSEPRDVPIAVVGPPEAVTQVEQQLGAVLPDAFDIEPADDAEAARQLVRDREAYGAIVLDPAGPPQLLTASAASPAVAQTLQVLGQQLSQDGAGTEGAAIEDVVPLPEDDPRGAGFASAALPMVMGGLVVGIGISFVVAGVWRRVVGVLVAASAAGIVTALVVQTWLGALEGSYWANAGVIALTVSAISMTLVGLTALLGEAGIGVGALVMLLLGNPLSGVTTAPEMLPAGWGTLGQLLPPGASGSLLRSTSFFDGAAVSGPLLVLAGWLVLGMLLAVIGAAVRPRSHAARVG